MSTYHNLTRGHGHDGALNVIRRLMPAGWSKDPALEMLALVMLDDHYKLCSPGDYILVAPGYFLAIEMLEVLDPAIARVTRESVSDSEMRTAIQRATARPFDIRVAYNSAMCESAAQLEAANASLPEGWRGRLLHVRLMNDDESNRLQAMLTVRSTGEVINLPSRPSNLTCI